MKYVEVTVFIKFKKKNKIFFLIVGLFFSSNKCTYIDKYTIISLSFFLYFLNFINAVTSTLFFPNPIESYHVHVLFLSYFAVYIVLFCMYLNTTCILSYVISMRFIVFSRLFYPFVLILWCLFYKQVNLYQSNKPFSAPYTIIYRTRNVQFYPAMYHTFSII